MYVLVRETLNLYTAAVVSAAKGVELFSPLIGLTEDQKQFYNLAREFADSEMRPKANSWDQDSIFPIETYVKTAEIGFAGIFIPEEMGGLSYVSIDKEFCIKLLN